MSEAYRAAAQEIATLINTRPQSPHVDELEAIIAGAMPRQHACARATTEDDPSLCALRQKLQEVNQLYEAAKDNDDWLPARDMADAADNELTELPRRIFATRPVTLHNLKQRAVLAKYWQEHNHHGEAWEVPDDCDAWEHTVMAHLIDGVMRIDAPPVQPSPELVLFRSSLEGVREFVRANLEPRDVRSQDHDPLVRGALPADARPG
jgi:hypothetical protein